MAPFWQFVVDYPHSVLFLLISLFSLTACVLFLKGIARAVRLAELEDETRKGN